MLVALEDTNGTVYTFSSVVPNYVVQVAVPSDRFMWNAVTTALRAANAGIRLGGQCRVNRVRVRGVAANGGA
jgi:hypothetical protein